jgi:hypothetical protein
MNFRAALRRLNRLFPPPSPEDLVNEEIRAALRPLTYDQILRLRNLLRKKLEGKSDDNDKQELRSIFTAAEPRKKKRNRPKKCDGRSPATKQSPSTSSGVHPMPAKGSMATNDAGRAKASAAPDSVMPPTVPVVLNDPLAHHPVLRPDGANERALAKRVQSLSPEQCARVVAEIDKHRELANFVKGKAKIARE